MNITGQSLHRHPQRVQRPQLPSVYDHCLLSVGFVVVEADPGLARAEIRVQVADVCRSHNVLRRARPFV